MIRIVMFDLGLTLIDAANKPFPHVVAALTAISALKTADGDPLGTCLVSDFTMATPPATVAKISALFKQYLAILDSTGLRPFFEPVAKRITLSTHASALKPDRKVFKKALSRLGANVALEDCLFITENGAHIQAARATLHMQTLQFRSPGSSTFDFDDWSKAPTLIAGLLAPQQLANTAGEGVDPMKPKSTKASGKTTGKGKGVATAKEEPSAEHAAEAAAFERSLAKHGQIAGGSEKSLTGITHEIETDEKGDRRLVRKRFSAF